MIMVRQIAIYSDSVGLQGHCTTAFASTPGHLSHGTVQHVKSPPK